MSANFAYHEKMDPAASGDADLARKEKVMASPLTRPRFSAKTELLMRMSAADQQIGYIIRFGTSTTTNTAHNTEL